jgi:hypothetical protein
MFKESSCCWLCTFLLHHESNVPICTALGEISILFNCHSFTYPIDRSNMQSNAIQEEPNMQTVEVVALATGPGVAHYGSYTNR